MKRMKKVFAVILSLCMMFTASCITKLTVEAEGATTYTLKVVDDEWRYQPNYPWEDTVQHRELYYMHQNFKDGDKVVIMESDKRLELELTKTISNLTFMNAGTAVVTAPYVEECYVLRGSVGVINADINKAYVYDTTTCNFNKNVQYLEITTDKPEAKLSATIGAIGEIAHVYAHEGDHLVFDIYDVKAGTFSLVEGAFNTAESNFSRTPSSNTVVSAPAQTTTTAPATSSSATDELDDVPKTGDIVSYYWMLGLAAVCMTGGLYLKKKNV
ncbi:MAG: hypothetical protein IJ324_06975 [Lachnospiraceae bacterium]|nr:hypothetical protein [Lachnospiraceae bacterium]